MKFKIKKVNQVVQAPDDSYVHNEWDATGRITVPDWAQCSWNVVSGPFWTWNEENHVVYDDCPICRTSNRCTQNVTYWPRNKTALVVHDYKPIHLS